MRFLGFFTVILLFCSCDFINLKSDKITKANPIATVYESNLYQEDIEKLLPKNISKPDSLVISKSIINSWAIKQIMLKKSSENNTTQETDKIKNLVEDYRQSLLINSYKEALIKQQLDTAITETEIDNYYELNKENFKLNEELVKIKYLVLDNNFVEKKEVTSLFKSSEIEDLEELEKRQLSFKTFQLNDSIWLPLDNVLLKIPFSKQILLKKSKFIQKQEALSLYLVTVKDVLKRNEIAPKSYITPNIKQLILHKRKIDLIREIEQIIVKDAIQNKNFTIH